MKSFKVRLHSNEQHAAEATDVTIRQLAGSAWLVRGEDGQVAFDEKGCATVHCSTDGFLRFALMQQGYVKEVL
jgi:hypothetical protein